MEINMTASSQLRVPFFRLLSYRAGFLFFYAGIFDGISKHMYSGTRRKSKVGNRNTHPPAASLPIRHGLSITIVLCRTAQNRAIQASKQARSPPYLYRTTQYNGVFQTSCIQHLRDMGGGGGGRRREEKRKGEGGGGGGCERAYNRCFVSFFL